MCRLIYFLLALFVVLITTYGNDEEQPIASIENGLIRGSYKVSYNGRKYMAFEGIPYAKPPIQKLRFREPEPIEPWIGILDATTIYNCIQLSEREVIGQEDCLYLNVYVPRTNINPDENLDVIVYIHGGTFMTGNPTSFFGPLYIMDRDVIYVNFNYRLGPFGFYNTGDKVFHGNYGLKDQTAVLEWIKKNIDKFGGNPNSVTLTGNSAGGASVHLHYFSLPSKGLFHRGFTHSGTALNPWAVKTDSWSSAEILATEVGCMDANMKVIYRCLKQRSALQIVNGIQKLYKDPYLPLVPFGPATESYIHTAFLVAMPYLQLASKVVTDVPLLISVPTEKGTFPAAAFYHKIDELNKNWNYWLPLMLEYYQYDETKKNDISTKIREFYFKDESLTKDNFAILEKLWIHRMFYLGAEKSAKLQANATESDVYFLMLGYQGEHFQPLTIPEFDVTLGVDHGMHDKLDYDATPSEVKNINNEKEEELKNILLDMLVSFARTGIPTIKDIDFQPVPKSGNLKYLSIRGPENITMKSIKRLAPHEFWRSLELREDENVYIIGKNTIQIK